jgi:hypothetical protein
VRGPESLQSHVADTVRSIRTPSPFAVPSVNNGVYRFAGEYGNVCLATALNWIEDDGWTLFHISCMEATDEEQKTLTYTFKKI